LFAVCWHNNFGNSSLPLKDFLLEKHWVQNNLQVS